jgi:hypothetical protein
MQTRAAADTAPTGRLQPRLLRPGVSKATKLFAAVTNAIRSLGESLSMFRSLLADLAGSSPSKAVTGKR